MRANKKKSEKDVIAGDIDSELYSFENEIRDIRLEEDIFLDPEDVKIALSRGMVEKGLERIDRAKTVFSYKLQGLTWTAIAKLMNISPATAARYYKVYLYIKKAMLCERYVKKDVEGVVQHIAELEEVKDKAFGSLISCEEGTPSFVATLKVITDVLKELSHIKLSVGLWTEDMFQGDTERETYEKKIIEMRKERGLSLEFPALPDKTEKKETLNIADKIDDIRNIGGE